MSLFFFPDYTEQHTHTHPYERRTMWFPTTVKSSPSKRTPIGHIISLHDHLDMNLHSLHLQYVRLSLASEGHDIKIILLPYY